MTFIHEFEMRHVGRKDEATGLLISEITEAALARMDEYSLTLPTLAGGSLGRVWKKAIGEGRWVLGYCYAEIGDKCMLAWRRLFVVSELRPAQSE